jgi:hypothetical protein
MFEKIMSHMSNSEADEFKTFKIYLQRHINPTENESITQKIIMDLCESKQIKLIQAFLVARNSIEMRIKLWDGITLKLK